ncbi:MAG: SDR family oxidoreductase [Anaerolineaceae bacterium]|nr:SDR family oxidoreductase [Anaerolineaceae bacterium]
MNYDLKGCSAIITGASQGLGFEICRFYVQAGANVIMCARNEKLLEEAHQKIKDYSSPKQIVLAVRSDVSKEEDVKRIVEIALTNCPDLNILVNNAGVYGPKGLLEDVDWSEWVQAIQINLLGSVLLCKEILPHFKSKRYGKIIQLSGGGATAPLPRISAYAASKAAVIRFIETLAEEVREFGIDVNAIAPGALNTRLLDDVIEAGPEKVGTFFYERALKQKATGGTELEKGAALSVFLASKSSDGITGKLISAVWDPWEKFNEHIEELQTTDLYTLRRIVPKDRGFNWGDV